MTPPDATRDMLNSWHISIVHADRSVIKKVVQSGNVHSLDMTEVCSKNRCTPCDQGTMTNTPKRVRAALEMRAGAVLHTDIKGMNFLSVVGTKYFVTFITKASGHASKCHMKTKVEASWFIKQYMR